MEIPRTIKKYPNRRLYDTSIGAYITLDDVKKLVIERIPFVVVDAKTRKNLTHTTLLQIIAEQETLTTPLFTTEILQEFIRFSNGNMHSAFSDYLAQATQGFTQQKELMKDQWNLYQKWFYVGHRHQK